jgi:hypothetical protein
MSSLDLSKKKEEFQKFLQRRKLSFNTFLFLLFGSWFIFLVTAIYLNQLDFSQWLGAGGFLVFWLIWLAISFWLGAKTNYQRIVWHTNQFFLALLAFSLIFQSPGDWFLILFEYGLLLFLSLTWAGACFFSLKDLLIPASLSITGLLLFFFNHSALFQRADPSLFYFLLSLLFVTIITMVISWNTSRSRQLLKNVYREKQNLEETAKVLRIRIQAKTKELRQQAETLKKENAMRTKALRDRVRELERFRKLMVGRELKMIELKKEIEQLKEKPKRKKKNGKNS